jgi:hypothetical protein
MTLVDLKPGDKAVKVTSGGLGEGRVILTVVKVLARHVVTDDNGREQKWRKDGGYPVGAGGYHIPKLVPGTPELLAEVERDNRKARLVHRLKAFDWSILDLDMLDQIAARLP